LVAWSKGSDTSFKDIFSYKDLSPVINQEQAELVIREWIIKTSFEANEWNKSDGLEGIKTYLRYFGDYYGEKFPTFIFGGQSE